MTERNARLIRSGTLLLLGIILSVICSLHVWADSGDSLTIHFRNALGRECGISDAVIQKDGQITLPQAPADPEAASVEALGTPAWKKNLKTGSSPLQTLTWNEAAAIAAEQGSGSVLTLYGTRALKLSYYNSSGNKLYSRVFCYEGTTVSLAGNPAPSNRAYRGWNRLKNAAGIWKKFESRIMMTSDLNLYLVTYPRIRYYNKNGTKVLYTGYAKRGSKVTLRQIPSLHNYRTMGWGLKKNTVDPAYQAGDSITLDRNLNLYASYKYLKYTVKFTNNDGTSKERAFTSLNTRAASGDSIKLPELPDVSPLVAAGWSAEKNSSTESWKAGANVRITKNTTFYAVYRQPQIFDVRFLDTNGSVFSDLERQVPEGEVVTLPSVPAKSGYTAKGWKIRINGKVLKYEIGASIKVSGNYRFYANYAENTRIVLHYNNGKTFLTADVAKGTKYVLPCMKNPNGYTFMGWTGTKGVTLSPTRPLTSYYEAGNIVTVKGTLHLYAVLMKRSEEGSIVNGQLYGSGSPDTSAYKEIIFVGDSRTVRLKKALIRQITEEKLKKRNVTFICKNGQGLKWFKDKGYTALMNDLKKQDASDTRPTAVIINLGVNDLGAYNEYVSCMKQIAPALKEKGCELFYMSVNPINSVMIKQKGFNARQESQVRKFNSSIKSGLSGTYRFIDVYSWLMQTGFSTNRGEEGYDIGDDDGLHYTVNTYKRIYLRCLQFLAGDL